jgi:hypothetical protein
VTPEELRARRVAGQLLAPAADRSPAEAVHTLGAVQAQDLPGALWALGVRTGRTAAAIGAELTNGAILRTHVLRPTWHLVSPVDLAPLVAATGPAVMRAAASMLRRLALPPETLDDIQAVLRARLAQGPASRAELQGLLTAAGHDMRDGVRFATALMHAESTGLICSGPVAGRETTVALAADRAPTDAPERAAVLTDLARRYFASRGPATLRDFRWWAGLAAADATAAVDAVRGELESARVGGRELLWNAAVDPQDPPAVLLLPNYDEYLVAYADRSDVFDPEHRRFLDARGEPIMQHVAVADGVVAGTWRVTARARRLEVAVTLFATPRARIRRGTEAAIDAVGRHRGVPVDGIVTVA